MSLENIEDVYPLSPMQQGMLFHSLYPSTADIYVVQWNSLLEGPLNLSAFKQAWQQALNRHSILRTAFVWEGVDELLQVVGKRVELPWQQYDWQDLTEEQQQERLTCFLQAEREHSFDLSHAPLIRFILIQLDQERYHFMWSFHHLLLDGWSVALLIEEVFASYEKISKGDTLSLPPSRPYRDYIAWLQTQDMEEANAFWQSYLAGFSTPTPLPIDNATSEQSFLFEQQELLLSQEMTTALQQLARQQHLTLNTLIQGAWALLLSRYSGQEDVVFGITVSGRPTTLPGVEEMLGLFINTLPLRVHVKAQSSLHSWLQDLQAQQYDIRQYEYTPLVQIRASSEVPAGHSLFESILVFENYPQSPTSDEERPTLRVNHSSLLERTNYPLAFVVAPGQRMHLELIYDKGRFEPATIQRMLQHLETLLTSLLAAEEHGIRLKELSLLSATERRRILHDWNQTRRSYPATASLPALFEAQVARTPDAIALSWLEQQFSYDALNACANQLARLLQHEGVQPAQLVGLYLHRSPWLLISLLAILKAGAAYLPVDLNSPAERVGLMLQDAQVALLLSEQDLSAKLPAGLARVLCLDTLDFPVSAHAAENLSLPLSSQYPAYVIYTSGSTGMPKGVCVPQQAVARLVLNTTFAQLDAQQRFLQLAPVSFDAATLEIWGALLNGGRLALFPESLPSLERIAQELQREAITLLWLTAGLFHQMVEHHLDTLAQVPQVLAGGEVLSASHVRRVLEAGTGTCLINGYGPTENTTFTCCYPMRQAEQIGASVPIGHPITNTRVYVLDEHFEPVPVGVPGELYAAGDGLATGYHQEPALTGARFVPDPWSEQPGARMYRTGDLVKYRHDGLIEFLGRTDQQVKLHGFRIELGEIEAALLRHPAVRQALVLLREDRPGDKRLVAYLVPLPPQAVPVPQMRTYLAEHLPQYMIPSAYVILEKLPLTPNGKIDRRALPAPEQSDAHRQERYMGPSTPTEQLLTDIWQQVLDIERIGIQDNFFELGGDSILGINIIARANQAGLPLTLMHLFQHQTIVALALVAERESTKQAEQTEQEIISPQELVDLDSAAFEDLISELSGTQE